jgi:prophage regulatory protein
MRLLRIDSVCERTGLSKSSVYKQMREGDFPKSIFITKGAKGWPETAVSDWINARATQSVSHANQCPPSESRGAQADDSATQDHGQCLVDSDRAGTHRIGKNTTRWLNSKIKPMGVSK